MSDNMQQQDASMEEILSSIRKILSSDDEVKRTYPKEEHSVDNPIELVDIVEAPSDPMPNEREEIENTDKLEGSEDKNFYEEETLKKQPWEKDTPSAHTQENIKPNTRLVSQSTLAASNAALSELTKHTKNHSSGEKTSVNTSVEDLLKSMLTPLLKDWLDKNLPTVIEKVVREEVRAIVNNTSK
jgi:cell pole-organizing protein PopZ